MGQKTTLLSDVSSPPDGDLTKHIKKAGTKAMNRCSFRLLCIA
ncbi:hypothetical protein Geoth_0273 [Parageobacillus thermoglucosidasius C56-YS93]|nr:hypothetical protein Geoth_0273 [Parageobacillus thermoglucosidasius C56-YS93]